jgi:hypothetical protein
MNKTRLYSGVLSLALLGACAGDAVLKDDEYGMEGELLPTPEPGKEDSQNRRGLLVATNTTRTQVWSAKNKWEDRDTPAAKKAGIAWPEDSGLNWDEKYAKWIESMGRTPGTQGWYETFMLTTPWGKSIPGPSLECAEMTIFLRVTFAAWYELPLFFEAVDSRGVRIYIGHNGVRTATGKYSNTPEFAIQFQDKSAMPAAEYEASWPKDTALRAKKLWDSVDDQAMIAPGATIGTYLDEIHLNKRAGHFTMLALNYLYSASLADTANTYNIVPEAVRAGDTVLHRWQRSGIGHTLVVKEVTEIGEGNLDVALISGSMPRRQGKWESGAASKQYFVSEEAGGPGTNLEGHDYAKLGGGLKRWRVTKNIGGYWTNTWMTADESHWINSTDYARIAARTGRFETLLGEVSPEQTRTELLAQIADARRHLSNFPASCSARERRERAFERLYDVAARSFGQTRAQVDSAHRDFMDYALAELEYTQSKTCCWNSTTPAMYAIIKEYAEKEKRDAEARGQCAKPTVFMSHTDGYDRWKAYAEQTGRGAQWVAWREDETCAQRGVASDSERTHEWTDVCQLSPGGGGTACTDKFEPNNSRAAAKQAGNGVHDGLRVCDADEDFLLIPQGGTVKITFSNAAGDLDLEALNASGQRIGISETTNNEEILTVPAGAVIRVYGYGGATGAYKLSVN